MSILVYLLPIRHRFIATRVRVFFFFFLMDHYLSEPPLLSDSLINNIVLHFFVLPRQCPTAVHSHFKFSNKYAKSPLQRSRHNTRNNDRFALARVIRCRYNRFLC